MHQAHPPRALDRKKRGRWRRNPDYIGGWRQRFAQEQEAASLRKSRSRSRSPRGRASTEGPSKLARSLLSQWAWGDISAVSLQRNANNASADGANRPLLRRLARLGGRGTSVRHAQGQLMRWFCKRDATQLVRTIEDSKQNRFIPPHVLFKLL